jgi:ABC-type nitrate/sulfonate/bicarbonate transport system permease component
MLSAPTPWHLVCGSCRARLRVTGFVGAAGLGLGIVVGVVVGIRVGLNGLAAELLPSIILLVGYEPACVIGTIAFGELALRD